MKFDWKDAWFYAEKMVGGAASEVRLNAGECQGSAELERVAMRMKKAADDLEEAHARLFREGELLEKVIIKNCDDIMTGMSNRISRITEVSKLLHREKERRPSTNKALERENGKLRLR